MTTRRGVAFALAGIVALALLHAVAFIVYEQPDWTDGGVSSDQLEYEDLARNLVHQGRYTTYADITPTVPEAKRTPGYPLFLAAVYLVFGESRLAVAGVHAVLFALVCCLMYAVGARIHGPVLGLMAAAATALYAPLPYYGAQALSMVLATLLTVTAVWLLLPVPTLPSTRRFVLAGLVCGALALVRPAFVLAPVWIALWYAVVAPRLGAGRPGWRALGGFLTAVALLMAPWLTYTAIHFGSLSPAPAGRVWRDLWEGTWHGIWPGRVHAQIMAIGRTDLTGEARDERLRRLGPDVARMRRFLDEDRLILEPIRALEDPRARVYANVAAERVYRRTALRNIAEDPLGYLWRRATHGTFTLWASHIPIRYRLIDSMPPAVIRAIWALQVLLLAVATWGIALLCRSDRVVGTFLLVPVLYVAVMHLPLRPDPRWVLPVMPLVLLFAVVAAASVWRSAPVGAPEAHPR
jgi:4-amino-4-deoxy-L-arabinose transferase-like glycosyltransferase